MRHRPLKTKKGIAGKFWSKKKPKKQWSNVYKAMHVGMQRQLKKAKAILA